MRSRAFIIRKTLVLLAGEGVCAAAMWGVFAWLGRLDLTVIVGGILGAALAAGNFFFLALAADRAAERAAAQDVKGGEAAIRMSYAVRVTALLAALLVLAKSGLCSVPALVLPLAFAQPILLTSEWIGKEREP